MGESFKLHAQSLSGYEDSLLADAQAAEPALAHHPGLAQVAAY